MTSFIRVFYVTGTVREFDTGVNEERRERGKKKSSSHAAEWTGVSVTLSEIKSSSSSWVQPLCLQPVRELRQVCGHPGAQEKEVEEVVEVEEVGGWGVHSL